MVTENNVISLFKAAQLPTCTPSPSPLALALSKMLCGFEMAGTAFCGNYYDDAIYSVTDVPTECLSAPNDRRNVLAFLPRSKGSHLA